MNIHTAIDIGSENIKILSFIQSEKDGSFSIFAKSSYPVEGVSYGYISEPAAFLESLKNAISRFSKENTCVLDEAFFSLSGFGLRSEKIVVNHQTAGGIISEFDIEKIQKKSISQLKKITSDTIIEEKLIKYTINGFEHFASPDGLSASKLSAEFLFITYPKNNLMVLEESIAQSGISAISFIPALISSASIALSNLDKKLGCALVDIGAETTSIIIYDNGQPIHYHVLKNGLKKVSESISLSEKFDFEKAEKIKKKEIHSKKVEKVIRDQLKVLAEKVASEIKSAGKTGILPGGIILCGGGSKISYIKDVFKKELSVPVKLSARNISDSKTDYHICYGNIIVGTQEEKKSPTIQLPDLLFYIKKFFNRFVI
jgi:cell division protein FtsA